MAILRTFYDPFECKMTDTRADFLSTFVQSSLQSEIIATPFSKNEFIHSVHYQNMFVTLVSGAVSFLAVSSAPVPHPGILDSPASTAHDSPVSVDDRILHLSLLMDVQNLNLLDVVMDTSHDVTIGNLLANADEFAEKFGFLDDISEGEDVALGVFILEKNRDDNTKFNLSCCSEEDVTDPTPFISISTDDTLKGVRDICIKALYSRASKI
jgi:hypothetical protein